MTRLEEKKIFDLIIFNSHFYGFSDIFFFFFGGRIAIKVVFESVERDRDCLLLKVVLYCKGPYTKLD